MRGARGIVAAGLATACAVAIAPGGAGAAAVCGPPGGTVRQADGVRFFTVSGSERGKAQVSLEVCSVRRPTLLQLAAGPPELVGFGAFHAAGPYAGFEVVAVQPGRGDAGRGTNLDVGWVDARTGAVRTNFLFIDRVRPRHVYAVDPQRGSLALLDGTVGHDQELYWGPYSARRGRFTGTDVAYAGAGWDAIDLGDEYQRVVPASLRVSGGRIRFRSTSGKAVVLDG